jgi:putative transposase
MVDEPVVAERGLLSVPDEVWDLAVRRAGVIGPLAAADVVGGSAVEAAAAELGLSRRQVYELLRTAPTRPSTAGTGRCWNRPRPR